MVVNVFHNRGKADVDKGQIFEGLVVPVDLYSLSLGAKRGLDGGVTYLVTTCLATYIWLAK